jgi:hypothetical protein
MVCPVFYSCTKPEPVAPVKHSPVYIKKMQERQELEKFISKYFIDLPEADRKDNVLLAKKINAFVHSYCTCDLPLEKNTDNLIKNCHTSCGGYVYVFRKISECYGLQSREVYLLNIPLQGNHSMVEVKYGEDKWALFDPTFGTFFTRRGKISEKPYSLDDLYFNCSPENLLRHVVQARRINPTEIALPLNCLYKTRSFDAVNMKLSTYLQAKDYGHQSLDQYSLLLLDIDMKKGVFQFGGPAKTIEKGDRQFLAKVNVLLNDKIRDNNIPYCTSFLGQIGEHTFKNGYHMKNLRKDSIYRLTLYGINPTGASLYPHFTDSTAVLQRTGVRNIPQDTFAHSQLFKARDTNAILILETLHEPQKFMRIFGIRIELDKTTS